MAIWKRHAWLLGAWSAFLSLLHPPTSPIPCPVQSSAPVLQERQMIYSELLVRSCDEGNIRVCPAVS